MKVKVTQKDIDAGKRGSACLCPVARALVRETDRVWWVDQHSAYCRDVDIDITLPWEVHEFIVEFDSAETVQPFEFEFLWSPSA